MRIRAFDSVFRVYLKILSSRRPVRPLADFRPDDVKNILLVSSTAIGDTLLSTPAIRAVRKRYPRARITLLLNRHNMELFSNNPNIDEAVPFEGGYGNFSSVVRELRKRSFDLAMVLHGNEPQATPLCYLSGAPFVIKLPNKNEFNFLLSNRTPVLGWDALGHGLLARLKTVELAGCAPDGVRMELFTDKKSEREAGLFLKESGVCEDDIIVGFQPGASTVSRQLFPKRFIELGKRLIKKYPGMKIVITGSPAEIPLCERIASGIGNGVVSSAGRISLTALPPLIKKFDAFVTGDTGPMHVAITVGTPIIALYAVADSRMSGPLVDVERHRIIQKSKTCDPCVSKRCAYQKCMEAITVEEVFSSVLDVLSQRRARA